MNGDLFGRNYKLVIKSSSGGEDLVFSPPMQITFNIEGIPNNHDALGRITVYGVSAATRSRIYNEYDSVSLSAGYGDDIGVIFKGEINNFETGRDGVNTYIRFYCRSFFRKWVNAYINKSWGENTPILEIIKDVAETFGTTLEVVGDFSDLPLAIKGMTAPGVNSVTFLTELSEAFDFKYNFESTKLVVIRNKASREHVTHKISSLNGMEGIPRVYLQSLEVDIKLNHLIRPADWIEVYRMYDQFNFSGMYTTPYKDLLTAGRFSVLSIAHQGDFYHDTWKTTIKALLLKG
ncbi:MULTISPECIES: phage protein [unclassified Photorhabdus]|uniref:phage protein n=1 Tax=unclassified Photorhabdus TaxID=2620880 RepID=UPI000DCF3526|nr:MULTISPECIES: hypothetical protein [unclassified Photorhabdus]RAW93948.1 hypothetical protein CKY03_21235 [Photorhabdus sp. S9-53]RAW94040.1 hypothetical protein CKY05_21155 [Photorhabdus sp. S10-54]RAW97506.1 hypothetical protein CKY04_21135 [Photorhabdus sp. S8-52]